MHGIKNAVAIKIKAAIALDHISPRLAKQAVIASTARKVIIAKAGAADLRCGVKRHNTIRHDRAWRALPSRAHDPVDQAAQQDIARSLTQNRAAVAQDHIIARTAIDDVAPVGRSRGQAGQA